ncbi:unnamed protein product [Triticum turgidum subsp. durum]|uniref:Transposase Tnp1/En/Spm-like domain-containing protein n=1 Tax=Triticum turgidum subsp. durum TaxID=4567 RepID=A0A9R1S6V4_TRITD|nr:unnamed protein product [Triticum turgidum subsp. durum]
MSQTRINVVESNEEYMVEEPIEHHNSAAKDVESSDVHERTTNDEEGFTDCDDADADENEDGKRIMVRCNDIDQPVGKEAKHLGDFLGSLARNGSLCCLSYKDWRLLKTKTNVKAILDQVKMRFLYPPRMEKYILKIIGDRWRQHKSDLKAMYFDEKKSTKANCNNKPNSVTPDQWRSLVNHWTTQKAKGISATNRNNCSMRKSTHTSGTKSFPRKREEMKDADPEKKYPHRAHLFMHTHKPKTCKNKIINAHVEELKDIMDKNPELADNSDGKTAWKGDALNKVLGDDKPSHVHGLGLVPNPKKLFDVSTSHVFQNTHFTLVEDTPNEDMLAFRVEMEKIYQVNKNQDAKIMELEEKMRRMERQPNQEISDPMATIGLEPSVDGHNSNRKRVLAPQVDGLHLVKKRSNNLQNKPSGSNDADLQASNKNSVSDKNKETMVHNGGSSQQLEKCSAAHKNAVQNQETPHNFSAQQGEINSAAHKNVVPNKETLLENVSARRGEKTSVANKLTKKTTKGANASSKSAQSGSLSWLGASELPAGTKVFLKSLKNHNRDVALATVVSCDPNFKLDGAEIRNEFWAVHVDVALVKTENLVRSRKNCTTLGNAEKTKIAWPSTFIQKING